MKLDFSMNENLSGPLMALLLVLLTLNMYIFVAILGS